MVTERKFIALLALLVFAVLAIVVNWPVLEGKAPLPAGIVTFFPPWQHLHDGAPVWPHVSELGDLVTAFYPWRLFTAQAFKTGDWPLWNPMALAGTPFLGATQSALFYPLTHLYQLFDTHTAWTLNILLRIVIAGFFTALFTAGLGCTRVGAIAAGLIYVLSGPFVIWQGQALGDAWVWLPAVLYSIDRICFRPQLTNIIILAVSFALPVLSGHPESAFHIAALSVVWAGYRALFFRGQIKPFFVLKFLTAALLGLALSAVQILPTLEWLTQIDAGLEGLQPARSAYEALAFFCRDIRTNTNSAGIHIPEAAAYAGMMSLLLCGFAFLGRHRRHAAFWILAIAAGLQIVYGFGPVNWLLQNVPIVRALKNNRVLFIVDFGVAVLAGLGLSWLQTEAIPFRERLRSIRSWSILGLGFLTSVAAILVLRGITTQRIPDWDQTPRSALLFLAAGAVVIALRLSGLAGNKTFAGLALGVIAADLVSFSLGAVPFARPSEIFPKAPVFDFLSAQNRPFRVAAVDSAYLPNYDMAYGISSISGYEIWSKRTARLMDGLRTPGVVGMAVSSEGILGSQDRILDLLNVRYLVVSSSNGAAAGLQRRPDRFAPVFAEGSILVFENRLALPRAFVLPSDCTDVAADEGQQLARLRESDFDPWRRVILAEDVAAPSSQAPCGGEGGRLVDNFTSDSPNRTSMDVDVDRPSVVVWSEMSYPGWHVIVDGQRQDLLRADYNLMAVAVPEGSHHIQFVFDPITLRIGGWISAVAAAASLLFVAGWRLVLKAP